MKTAQTISLLFLLLVTGTASAADSQSPATLFPEKPPRVWQIDWSGIPTEPMALHAALANPIVDAPEQTAPPPRVTEYSHGYQVRAKIHKYASFATLPLFATELALGQSLYNDPGGGKKTAHAIVGAGIGSLFAVNSVTGVWNLLEGSKDPVGRKRRLTHGILMLAADAGFFATFLNAPGSHELDFNQFNDSRSTHRTVAITSIGLATAGYLTMILGGK
jgi:hypothetical protein